MKEEDEGGGDGSDDGGRGESLRVAQRKASKKKENKKRERKMRERLNKMDSHQQYIL